VVVLKRPIQGELLLTDGQLNLAFIDTEDGIRKYELTGLFKELARTAEQLGLKERIKLIARHAYRKLLALAPPLPARKCLPAPG
jgi:hypothetical protein